MSEERGKKRKRHKANERSVISNSIFLNWYSKKMDELAHNNLQIRLGMG